MDGTPDVVIDLGVNASVSAAAQAARSAIAARDQVYDAQNLVTQAGVVGDNATVVTALFQKIVDDTMVKGGGRVGVPPGTYLANIKQRAGVELVGLGPRGCVEIKSPAGSNLPAVYTEDFAARVGTDDMSGTSPHDFALENLTLNGNAAQQTLTGAARDLCAVLQLYGYRYRLVNLMLKNGLGAAGRMEWGQYGEFPMQSTIRDIDVDTCNRDGVLFNGPHDTVLDNIVIKDAGQEADNTYCGLMVGSNGVGLVSKFHAWHNSTTARRMRMSLSSAGNGVITHSHFEGGRGLYESRGGKDVVSSSRFYGCFGYADGAMIDLWAGNDIISDCIFENNGRLAANGTAGTAQAGDPFADVWTIRAGRSWSKALGVAISDTCQMYNFGTRGVFDLTGDGGLNRWGGIGYGNKATNWALKNALSVRTYISAGDL